MRTLIFLVLLGFVTAAVVQSCIPAESHNRLGGACGSLADDC